MIHIPPFLNNGKFTESEVNATKSIARCHIHVERANARLKYFKIQWSLAITRYMGSIVNDRAIAEARYIETYRK